MSEAHRVYEAVQQDKPVFPMKIKLGSDESIQNMFQSASLNPYSAALHKNFDSEFQEFPGQSSQHMCSTQKQLSVLVSNP